MSDKSSPPAEPRTDKANVPEPILRQLDRRAELLMRPRTPKKL